MEALKIRGEGIPHRTGERTPRPNQVGLRNSTRQGRKRCCTLEANNIDGTPTQQI